MWKNCLLMSILIAAGGCAGGLRVMNELEHADFATRCADPSVIRCFGFEHGELAVNGGPVHWSSSVSTAGTFANGLKEGASLKGRIELTDDHYTSGKTSIKFFMPSKSSGSHAGQFYANFSDDLSQQVGEGEQLYIQWRQRFSSSFISNRYRRFGSWKQLIVGEGDRPNKRARSCSQLELVVTNKNNDVKYPTMYHSCRGKDGNTQALFQDAASYYKVDQWMTFQLVVSVGTWYQNDKHYRQDSVVELWVTPEGGTARRVISSQHYDLANKNPVAKYGKVWLLPYLTGKDKTQEHPDAFTWYDDLIISRAPIAEPL